jgi:predicted RNase H-like HicB family nuclease
MLTEYLGAATKRARYEILNDDGGFYGEIPECRGVYATGPTLEACRSELADVLEDWVLFRIHKGLALPEIDGLELRVRKEELAI